MYIDFHCHGRLTSSYNFDIEYFKTILDTAIKKNIDAVVFCEHFYCRNFYNIFVELNNNFSKKSDYFEYRNIKIFCGLEVDFKEGGHIVLFGREEDVINFRKNFDNEVTEEDFLSFDEALKLANKYDLIKIAAHPFRQKFKLDSQENLNFELLDAIELNGRDLKNRNRLFKFAKKINKNIIAGSDSHMPIQVGSVKTKFKNELNTIVEIKDEIINGKYDLKVNYLYFLINIFSDKLKEYKKARIKSKINQLRE